MNSKLIEKEEKFNYFFISLKEIMKYLLVENKK